MRKPNVAKEYKRILKQEQKILKIQAKEKNKRMEKEQAYTYLEFKNDFNKVYKVFDWKDKHTKDYIHIDSVKKRVYVWNIEDTASVIRQLIAYDENIEMTVYINHKWGEPF